MSVQRRIIKEAACNSVVYKTILYKFVLRFKEIRSKKCQKIEGLHPYIQIIRPSLNTG